jgi:streptogramin lyase
MGTHPLAARAALLGAIAIGAVLFSSPSSSGKSELTVPEISVRHFHTLLPQALAIGGDGSVWMTDKYYGISRLRPDGHLKSYSFGADRYSDFAVDLVTGPDGAIWFAATDTVGRIDPEGATPIRTWPVGPGWMAYAITSAYGALWFTNEGAPARIGRLTTTGAITNFKLGGRWSYELPGITAGPAGSIWFTQLGYYRDPADAIGRISAEGRYAHWRLPDRRAHPLRIAAGPDGNLWFTEQHAHAIGRITPTGEIRNFPLPNGLSPTESWPASTAPFGSRPTAVSAGSRPAARSLPGRCRRRASCSASPRPRTAASG